MEETFSIKGIILTREAFRERDSRVSVYSLERGKQVLVARGTKKITSKLAGYIEPISLVNIMGIRGKYYNYLGSAMEEDSYKRIKEDFNKLYFAGTGIKMFNELTKENIEEREVFFLLKKYLETLDGKKLIVDNLELFFNMFSLKLISLLGYTPELFVCTRCKKKIVPGGNRFNSLNGGVVCVKCLKSNDDLTITDNCIKLLRLVIDNDLIKLANIKLDSGLRKEAIKIISSFLQYNK